MADYRMQAPDGKTYQITGPDGATDEQVRSEIIKQNPHLSGGTPAVPAAPPPTAALPVADTLQAAGNVMKRLQASLTRPPTPEDAVTRALRSVGPLGLPAAVLATPGGGEAARGAARTTIPMAVGALTGGASLPVQALAQAGTEAGMQGTGIAPKSIPQIIAAGALPFLAAGAGRLARAVPRMVTRLVPSQFRAAQQGAQEEAARVASRVGPPEEAGELFRTLKGAAKPPAPPVVFGPPKPRLALPPAGGARVTGPGGLYEQGTLPEVGRVIQPTMPPRAPMTGPRSTLEEAAALMRGEAKPYVPMGVPPAQPNIVVETAAQTAKPIYAVGGPGFGVMRHGTLPKAPAPVRAATAESIPAKNLQAMLDDLEQSIPKEPTSPGLKTVREFMAQARAGIQGGQISLGELMKLRLDAGRSLKRAPEVAALYKGILGDLEQAGAAGGPGAQLAMKALEAGRREHGSQLFRDLVEKASTRRSNLTGELPLLDMAQLAKHVQANKEQLLKQLGPEGVGQIEQFLVRFRALPPGDAYNFANKMALGGFGTAGFFGGGPIGAVGAAGLYELLNNAKAVGRNPAELNRFLIMLSEGARSGLGGMAESAVKAKR